MTKNTETVTVTFIAPFKFSPDGVNIIEYPAGKADVSPRCAEVAEQDGKLKKAAPKKTADEKAKAEAEAKAKSEAEAKAKAEAEAKAKAAGSVSPETAAATGAPEISATTAAPES